MKNFTFPFKNKIKKSNPKAGFLIIVLALGCQKVLGIAAYFNNEPAPPPNNIPTGSAYGFIYSGSTSCLEI